MHYYSAAGIPWYLLVEQDSATLCLDELVGSTYQEHSVTKPGQVLHLAGPIEADLCPDDLLPSH
jgi:hypothetical protein